MSKPPLIHIKDTWDAGDEWGGFDFTALLTYHPAFCPMGQGGRNPISERPTRPTPTSGRMGQKVRLKSMASHVSQASHSREYEGPA